MKFRTYLTLIVCLFLLSSCRDKERVQRLDLIQQLASADKVPDTQLVLFGTPEARAHLLSGWGNPEKQGGTSFQWAVAQQSAFHFRTPPTREKLYIHIRASSFFPNTARVLLNRQPIGSIDFPEEPELFTFEIPGNTLAPETNVVEFQFAELRTPENKKDTRQLAAAFYHAIVSPSKFAPGDPQQYVKEGFWSNGRLALRSKKRSALSANTGLSIRYYERLTPDAVLNFGTYFHPSAISEEVQSAQFQVTLRDENGKENRVFDRLHDSGELSENHVSLAKYVEKPGSIYELEFRLKRSAIFDGSRAAWLEPQLEVGETPAHTVNSSEVESIRRGARNGNVLFIILDAAGANHFSSYGYFRKTTPVIDALAAEGVQFQHAYTQAVYTLASTASLMSGLDPLTHRIITRKSRLPADTITLAERFAAGGYSTGTFVANGNASGIFGMTQGFQEVAEVFREPNYSGWASDITNRFTGWLDKNPRKPFFAYLHYREPHGPFNPPEKWKFQYTDPSYDGIAAREDVRRAINFGEIEYTQADKDYITALYDANLNYGDYEVGRVLQKLRSLGIYDNTLIVVTSDHGEAFWEHNFQGHNSQLYEESIRIPLVMKLPKRSGISGKKIDAFVRTIDQYPTLVDVMGLSRRDMKTDGHSILPYIAGAKDDGRPVLSQTILEQVYAYRLGDYKFIVRLSNRAEELYDLKSDPLEKTNLLQNDAVTDAFAFPFQGRFLRTRLNALLAYSKRAAAQQKGERAILDENTTENLKALGYIDE